jgi:hypothetical protein
LHATQANTREGNVVVAQDAIKFPKEAIIASVDHAFDMGRSDGAEHRDPVMAPAVREWRRRWTIRAGAGNSA